MTATATVRGPTLADLIEQYGPCAEGAAWLRTQPGPAEAWSACRNPEWLLWAADKLGRLDDRMARRLACAFVRRTPLADGRTAWELLDD